MSERAEELGYQKVYGEGRERAVERVERDVCVY